MKAYILNDLSHLLDFATLYSLVSGRDLSVAELTRVRVIGYFAEDGRMVAGFVLPASVVQRTPLCLWALGDVSWRDRMRLRYVALRQRVLRGVRRFGWWRGLRMALAA